MRANRSLFHVTVRLFASAFAILTVYENRTLAGWALTSRPVSWWQEHPPEVNRERPVMINPLKNKIYVEE